MRDSQACLCGASVLFLFLFPALCHTLALPNANAEPEPLAEASPWPEPIPMPWAFALPDPEPQFGYSSTSNNHGGCGPPRLLQVWPNVTASHGEPFKLSCPLDTRNSCLIDMVEWYFSTDDPRQSSSSGHQERSRRKLLKHVALAFDPLMLYFPSVSQEHSGWYTCVVGNGEGRNEGSAFVDVKHQSARLATSRQPISSPSYQTALNTNKVVVSQSAANLETEELSSPSVQSRFPVYSRFRGNRGFSSSTAAPPQELKRRRRPRPQAEATREGLEAIHQHLRYIYEKVEDLDDQMANMDRRLSHLERA